MDDGSLVLLYEVTRLLSLNQRELAQAIDTSYRTVQRIHAGRSHLSRDQWGRLARAVHPKNPELAARIAAWERVTLVDFGIAPPPPRPPPAAALPPPVAALPPARAVSPRDADSVVCAAADIMNVPPRVARPVVAAAFARAREMGLSVEAVAAALQASKPADQDEKPR
jgi:hypothetical protein